jgi:ligand-binding SRPBCC domain-containing protein
MPTFSRRTHIKATLEDVWAFHSTVDGLTAITPSIANLVVEDLSIPGDGQTLVEGSEMVLSARPIPGGPRVRMGTKIVERSRSDGEAVFVDELQSGPLAHWRHTHRFVAEGEGTALIDRIEYRTGYGRIADAAFKLGLTLAFRDRHRRTCETLAGT